MTQYYTLSTEQIKAIATRSAQIAIEQVLGGVRDVVRNPDSYLPTNIDEDDKRPLTEYEMQTLKDIFSPEKSLT